MANWLIYNSSKCTASDKLQRMLHHATYVCFIMRYTKYLKRELDLVRSQIRGAAPFTIHIKAFAEDFERYSIFVNGVLMCDMVKLHVELITG